MKDFYPEGLKVWVCGGVTPPLQKPFWFEGPNSKRHAQPGSSFVRDSSMRNADGRGWYLLQVDCPTPLNGKQVQALMDLAEYIEFEGGNYRTHQII